MRLEACTDQQLNAGHIKQENLLIMINKETSEVRIRISFGGLQMNIDEDIRVDQFIPEPELLKFGIEELSIEYKIPDHGEDEHQPGFTLLVYPDGDFSVSSSGDGRDYFHLKIREWYFVAHESA